MLKSVKVKDLIIYEGKVWEVWLMTKPSRYGNTQVILTRDQEPYNKIVILHTLKKKAKPLHPSREETWQD